MINDTSASVGPRDAFLVARRDLRNEPLFFACLVFSIAAIIVPLMFLLSVKIGFVDRLKEDFIKDPRFREIRPDEASIKSDAVLDFIRNTEGVVFIQPSVTFITRSVDVMVSSEGRRRLEEARLIPTGPGDPEAKKLISGRMPRGDEAVISADLADKYGLAEGSSLVLVMSRLVDDKTERQQLPVSITGVMSGEAAKITSIWVPSLIDIDIERFRAGLGVSSRAWEGVDSIPKQSFSGMLIRTQEPLGDAASTALRIRFGSNDLESVNVADVYRDICPQCKSHVFPDGQYYRLLPASGRYSAEDIKKAGDVLSEKLGTAWGISEPIPIEFSSGVLDTFAAPSDLLPRKLSLSEGRLFMANDEIVITPATAEALDFQDGDSIEGVAQIFRSNDTPVALALPLRVIIHDDAPTDAALISASLGGMLNRAREVNLSFDPVTKNFNELAVGFRGFRAIADSFESVPYIVAQIESWDVPVRTMIAEIERLQRLERSLNILVTIVAIVAITGASAILASSYFANVQRKIMQYACLRLIGFDKRTLSLIPLFQALLTGFYGFFASAIIFLLISVISNRVVADAIGFDAQLSKFSASHYSLFLVLVLLCSMLSAFFAVRLATSTDPSGALKS